MKIGVKIVRYGRSVIYQIAVMMPGDLFQILGSVAALRPRHQPDADYRRRAWLDRLPDGPMLQDTWVGG